MKTFILLFLISLNAFAGYTGPNPKFTSAQGGNLKISANTLSSEDTNGDINLTPNGTGKARAATATTGTNTTQIASTAFVQQEIAAIPPSGAITSLTGDVTGTGPGATATTLATVNGNVGAFGSATQVASFTVNGKGLITAASDTSIQIAESQVTNLVSDLALKAPLASPALTGTPTAPTATFGTNTTQLATTAFVQAAVTGGSGCPPQTIEAKSANFTADYGKQYWITASVDVQLPAPLASQCPSTYKILGNFSLTFLPAGAEKIDNVAANKLFSGTDASVDLDTNGTDWVLIR